MERVFNGGIALLSILIAVFTFAYIQYIGLEKRPEAQEPYLWIVWFSGALVVASGASALTAHLRLGPDSNWGQYWFFTLTLAGATAFPVILWWLK